ncbi:unnamed protein product, partial [Rotaria sp. Silwood2]
MDVKRTYLFDTDISLHHASEVNDKQQTSCAEP